MMTIKHVTPNGDEFVKQVKSVTFTPASSKLYDLAVDSLWLCDDPAAAADEITSGTVYVMNSEGKTVAVYRLGASIPATKRDDVFDQNRAIKQSLVGAFIGSVPA